MNYLWPKLKALHIISYENISFPSETVAHLNVSSDLLVSQFPTGAADSHCSGNAAESSTELTETKLKVKVKVQSNRESPYISSNGKMIPALKP